MSYSRRNAAYGWQGVWSPDSTPTQVRNHVTNVAYTVLAAFDDAAMVKDVLRMDAAAKEFRALATHLDAYRRMKVRQWRKKESAPNANVSSS